MIPMSKKYKVHVKGKHASFRPESLPDYELVDPTNIYDVRDLVQVFVEAPAQIYIGNTEDTPRIDVACDEKELVAFDRAFTPLVFKTKTDITVVATGRVDNSSEYFS